MMNVKYCKYIAICILIIIAGLNFNKNNVFINNNHNIPLSKSEGIEKKCDDKKEKFYKNIMGIIQSYSQKDSAKYSVYIKLLDNKMDAIVYQNAKMRAASMIKVFIMAKAFEDVKNGLLNLEKNITLTSNMKVGGAGSLNQWENGSTISVEKLLIMMITESDNTATNILIDLLGMDRINQYIKVNGYDMSVLQRKMMDFESVEQGKENYTSVDDIGEFFSNLYYRQCVNAEYDEKMMEILFLQTDKECLPAALPKYKIAHKTGELTGLYHDGGIVFSQNNKYILCIFTDEQSDRSYSISNMKQLAKTIDEAITNL